ncbi:MAG: hypothetical protein ACREQ2_12840 [Candidatus Binatia bacterium]
MDFPKHSKPDSALLLVKEIEILQTQTRLMEICLKQAQRETEDTMARMEQQYNGELTGLRAALTTVAQTLAARQSAITPNPDLLERVKFLEAQLGEQQHVFENCHAELKSSRSDAEYLRARFGELQSAASSADLRAQESAKAERHSLINENTRLRSTLARQECASARQESIFKAERDKLTAEIAQRCVDLEQQREIANQANVELERLRREIAGLDEQKTQSELARGRIEEDWRQATNFSRELEANLRTKDDELRAIQFNARASKKSALTEPERQFKAPDARRRIQELQTELRQTEQIALNRQPAEEMTMDTDDRNKQPAGNATEVQKPGATQSGPEQSLRNEIDRLLHEAQEKNQILQDRNDELVQVKAEMDKLQERLNQLESSTSRAQSALAGDAERMHTEFQAQLALLQAELSQKEWALEDKQAAARGIEQKYREEIESLRRRLAQRDTAINQDGGEFVLDESRVNRAQKQQFEAAKNTDPSAGAVNLNRNHRRWHSGVGWKRRWRE